MLCHDCNDTVMSCRHIYPLLPRRIVSSAQDHYANYAYHCSASRQAVSLTTLQDQLHATGATVQRCSRCIFQTAFVHILLMQKILLTKLFCWPSCLMGVLQVH